MLDLHSHLLPCIDDGSRSLEESLALLDMLREQGISTVAATPHFYANSVSVQSFIENRNKAFRSLVADEKHPKVLLGAEVLFYSGISRLEGIERLCIEGTKLLLLEMPFAKWTDSVVKELLQMSRSGSYTVVLAHIERYYDMQNGALWQRLKENDVLFQVNASFLLSLRTRRKAIRLLKNGFVHFLGSDCHNTADRPPMIGDAYGLLSSKLGEETVCNMLDFGYSFFDK